MNEQQRRYCALNGDPIHMTLMEKVRVLPEYKAAGLAAVFNLCVTAANVSPEQMMVSVGGSLAGLAMAKGATEFFDWLNLSLWYGKDFRELAIDKEPDATTPPTSLKNLKDAQNARAEYAVFSFITGNKLALIGFLGLANAFGGFVPPAPEVQTSFQLGMGVLGTLAGFASVHFGNAALCHHRVMKQLWNVMDLPKPMAQKQDALIATPQLNSGI